MPYEDEIVRIAGIAQGSENEVFKKRAQSIMKLLDAGKWGSDVPEFGNIFYEAKSENNWCLTQ